MPQPPRLLTACLVLLLTGLFINTTALSDPLDFDDQPLTQPLHLPNWFTLSFLDLQESLEEAMQQNKKGLILYFGRKDCAYCKAQLETNWGQQDIIQYTQQHYNVVAIDADGQKNVTDFDGQIYSERKFAARMKTDFTPAILFYEKQGKLALKLSGYRPPYQFRAALEYVADAHYNKESFQSYLTRAEKAFAFGQPELNEHDAFLSPPYLLNDTSIRNKPLIVFFEHPVCHACDVMHGGPMSHEEITNQLQMFNVVQLDSTSSTPLVTPSGIKSNAADWAKELKLDFAPSLIFFDQQGKEIIRVSSVLRLYRMKKLLSYILSKAYLSSPTFQTWRSHRNKM